MDIPSRDTHWDNSHSSVWFHSWIDRSVFGSLRIIPYIQWSFYPAAPTPPEPRAYCEHFNIEEIKRSAPWVPIVISMNYILIFLWVSFFSMVFWDPQETSIFWYAFYYIVFVSCCVAFLFFTNLFRRKMEPSLFTMSCNLITLFFCGIVTSSMNNLTHYLHKKRPSSIRYRFFCHSRNSTEIRRNFRLHFGGVHHDLRSPQSLSPSPRSKQDVGGLWANFEYHDNLQRFYGVVDTPSGPCSPLPPWFSELRSAVDQEHLHQPGNNVRPRVELRRPHLQRPHGLSRDRNASLRRALEGEQTFGTTALEVIYGRNPTFFLEFLHCCEEALFSGHRLRRLGGFSHLFHFST